MMTMSVIIHLPFSQEYNTRSVTRCGRKTTTTTSKKTVKRTNADSILMMMMMKRGWKRVEKVQGNVNGWTHDYCNDSGSFPLQF